MTPVEPSDRIDASTNPACDMREREEGNQMAEATITAKQLAQQVGTDPKSFRRFLRAQFRAQELATPGQGGRYAFTKSEARALARAFSDWAKPKVKAPEVVDPAEGDVNEDVEDLDFEVEDETPETEGDPTWTEDDEENEEDSEEVEDLTID